VLWSGKAQLTFGAKDVTVEARNPLTSARCNIEIIDGVLDIRRDLVPIKLRILIDNVCRRIIPELLVKANLFKFEVKRIGFSQIMRIAKLANEVCGS